MGFHLQQGFGRLSIPFHRTETKYTPNAFILWLISLLTK
ncbi:hypothetical protein A11S_1321 [Micavibrio aeruginosavorus EPB]|uniref:Uncharacterized protein n=1 Tax=Micavibrio aeruginosavorus EPB TaxID=349215 RepID=M4VI19_9BACT|nr:hypothetical protein A11S_1321 [Micavibrio aeruginosavorus EPB]